jgi:hypothetical protein
MVFVRLRPPMMKMDMKMGKMANSDAGVGGMAGMHDGHTM